MKAYWDVFSLIIYISQAFIGMLCLRAASNDNRRLSTSRLLLQPYSIVFISLWTIFASCRLVKDGIGGSDAIEYISYYLNCFRPTDLMEHNASDLAFQWLNKCFRFFSIDYHFYFLFVYAFMAFAILRFVQRYNNKLFNFIPLFLAFYVYLRGYSSMRSNLSQTYILLGLTAVADRKFLWAYFFMICSVLTHKAGILFAMSIPYLHYVYFHEIKTRYLTLISILMFAFAIVIREWFIIYATMVDLQGAYASYASNAKEANNPFGMIVECFLQYILAIVIVFCSGKIKRTIKGYGSVITKTVDLLLYICYYDMMLIPLNLTLGIWRGNEFLYIPRLCMWSVIIFVYTRNYTFHSKVIVNVLLFLFVVSWFVFRLSRTYESTCLMPYIFSPLANL